MGTVYLVGAGPGDPGLITLNGIELLKICDVVIYDRLASFQLLEYLRDDCVKIYVGKEAGRHSKTQEEINKIIVESAGHYEKVVRLKGGDPFVFGRGGEEIEELQKYNIPYEVVPGVTSAISVPASVGIPVTHRGLSQSFHVITGHTKSSINTLTDDYDVLAKLEGTLVFLMGLNNLELIIDKLIENGKDIKTPVAVISNGTINNEKTVRGTLTDIVVKVKEQQVISPAIIVVGHVAALDFHSTTKKALSNVKIGITGTKVLHQKLKKELQNLGATVYSVCDMKMEETPFLSQLVQEIREIEKYQWIIFTSQNAIKIFFDKMKEFEIDRRKLSDVNFAVIGNGTEQVLKEYGYYADFIPSKYTTKNLAEEFSDKVTSGDYILIPRALRGSEELTKKFNEKGIQYNEISIYDVKGKLTENMEYLAEMNCLIFASASGVIAFFDEIIEKGIKLPPDIKIACIGEVTMEMVKKYGFQVEMIADESTVEGLVQEIAINY